MKVKGEKKRYTHLNAEFQRIEGEIRKSFKVNNAKKMRKKMGKTSDLFKKIKDIKGTFHAKMAQYRIKEYGLNRNRHS